MNTVVEKKINYLDMAMQSDDDDDGGNEESEIEGEAEGEGEGYSDLPIALEMDDQSTGDAGNFEDIYSGGKEINGVSDMPSDFVCYSPPRKNETAPPTNKSNLFNYLIFRYFIDSSR